MQFTMCNSIKSDINVIKGVENDMPYPPISIGLMILQKIREHGDKIAFVNSETEEVLTFRDVLRKSVKVACALKRMGLKSGDTIAILSENHFLYFIPYLASLCNGIITSTLNYEYTKYELKHCLNLTDPKIVFCMKSTLETIQAAKEYCPTIQTIILMDSHSTEDTISLDDLIQIGNDADENLYKTEDVDIYNHVACVLNSSGTTGLPKGVMLTHNNLRRIMTTSGPKYINYTKDDVTLLNLPCFHIFGTWVLVACLLEGVKVVFMKKFKPDRYLYLLEIYKITKLFIVPPLAIFLTKTDLVNKYNLSYLKGIFSGGAALTKEVAFGLQERLGVRVHQMFGMTETTGCSFFNTLEKNHHSIGRLVPGLEGMIADIKTGVHLGPNEVGELCIRGENVMKGYIKNETATKESFDDDGFIHSGDVGYYDEDEHFYVVDRIKEMIKHKGFQISPVEIEATLITHEGIKDAAVVGLPDERAGELPFAFIVKQNGYKLWEKEVVDFVAERLSPQKRLHGVKFIDEIPKNPGGKILRKQLVHLLNNSNAA